MPEPVLPGTSDAGIVLGAVALYLRNQVPSREDGMSEHLLGDRHWRHVEVVMLITQFFGQAKADGTRMPYQWNNHASSMPRSLPPRYGPIELPPAL